MVFRRNFFNLLFVRNRAVITAVIITAIIVGTVTYLWTRNSATTVVVPSNGGAATSSIETATSFTCEDNDASEEEGGIYVAGEAKSFDPRGFVKSEIDGCASLTVLNEARCVPDEKTGERAPRLVAFECSDGCSEGACQTKSAAAGLKKFSFPNSSSLSWEQDGVRLAVTGLTLGRMPVPSGLLRLDGKDSYKTGEEIYALTLAVKVAAENAPECVRVNFRRLLNEEGDLMAPNTRSFSFVDGSGCIPKAGGIYIDQQVTFVVPESEREFTLTTGGQSNVFFVASVKDDGTLTVEIPSQEGG